MKKSHSKSYALDSMSTSILQKCIEILAPFITQIVNKSLQAGHVPDNFKEAMAIPLLKKNNLASNLLNNYRPDLTCSLYLKS